MPTLVKMKSDDEKEYEQLSDESQKFKSQSVDNDDAIDKDAGKGADGKESEQLSDESQKCKSQIGDNDGGTDKEEGKILTNKDDIDNASGTKDDSNNENSVTNDNDIDKEQPVIKNLRRESLDGSSKSTNDNNEQLSDSSQKPKSQNNDTEINMDSDENDDDVNDSFLSNTDSMKEVIKSLNTEPISKPVPPTSAIENNADESPLEFTSDGDMGYDDEEEGDDEFGQMLNNVNHNNNDDENSNISDSQSQTSTQSSDSSHGANAEDVCGYCNKFVLDSTSHPYRIKCYCCTFISKVHKECVPAILKHNMPNTYNLPDSVSSMHFNKVKFPIYCNKCQQDCFWCKVRHESKFLCIQLSCQCKYVCESLIILLFFQHHQLDVFVLSARFIGVMLVLHQTKKVLCYLVK